ncbi:methyltransferase-like protein 7A isoform X4 [Mangifera indica]|uniref:methyltransferase-like protein 7A isoform X4 n=1 Tax=Mangifera indica TaxID=29780 RepID=UPI001CFBA69A|nr:methyltransferase-like protein 7A isoform X4 [Mangifera indica]
MIIPSYSLPSSFFINIKVTCSSQKTKLPIARERLTLCSCGRRHFIEAATTTALLPLKPSSSSELLSDYTIAVYKSQIFGNLRGNAEKVLEIGIGTGPNLKYYANDPNIQVFGVDPNIKMEKYAQAAAVATGLPLTNFKFLQAVGEAIPLRDESVDAVVGTLVLCSVKDVGMTLQEVKRVLKPSGLYVFVEHVAAKDGTLLKFWQSVLDPIQQIVADGCHLTRESGKDISEAGFSGLEVGNVYLSNASLINPHVYGIACK